jgi:hypothetical protein
MKVVSIVLAKLKLEYNMKINHTQIVQDYKKLVQMYAVPEDLTGGLVVEEVLMEAVVKGTKLACAKAILEIIVYGFQGSNNEVYRYQSGSSYKEISVFECEFIRYIADAYLN